MGYKEKSEKTGKEIDSKLLSHVPAYKVAEGKILNFCKMLESDPNKAFDDLILSLSIENIDSAMSELNVKGTTDYKIGKTATHLFNLDPLQNILENIHRVNEMGKSILTYAILKANPETSTISLTDLKTRLDRAKFHKIGVMSASSAPAHAKEVADTKMQGE